MSERDGGGDQGPGVWVLYLHLGVIYNADVILARQKTQAEYGIKLVLLLFQVTSHFVFSKYMSFSTTHLNIH